jgi:hypothetical protein
VTIRSFRPPPFSAFLASACLLLLLLAATGSGSAPQAQSDSPRKARKPEKPYALIYGTVFDSAGRSVYGVRVKIRRASDKGKKARWELFSDHSGEFAQRVPPGPDSYVIWADLKGYKPLNGKKLEAGPDVTVRIQNDERADISLHLK